MQPLLAQAHADHRHMLATFNGSGLSSGYGDLDRRQFGAWPVLAVARDAADRWVPAVLTAATYAEEARQAAMTARANAGPLYREDYPAYRKRFLREARRRREMLKGYSAALMARHERTAA